MNNTTVYTDDTKNSSVYSTTDKLYLAYGDCYDDHVMVGKNASDGLNNGLHIDKAYWGGSTFWLRAPYKIYNGNALGAWPAYFVKDRRVEFYSVNADYALVPAFELNLSSLHLLRQQQHLTDSFQKTTHLHCGMMLLNPVRI